MNIYTYSDKFSVKSCPYFMLIITRELLLYFIKDKGTAADPEREKRIQNFGDTEFVKTYSSPLARRHLLA